MCVFAASLPQIDLHIIGGYEDETGFSVNISVELLNELHSGNFIYNVVTFCVGKLNTVRLNIGQVSPHF